MIKHEKKEMAIWECSNGHWSRVEFLMADGIVEKAICPVCNEEMKLGTRKLPEMLIGLPREYTISYKTKGRKKNG